MFTKSIKNGITKSRLIEIAENFGGRPETTITNNRIAIAPGAFFCVNTIPGQIETVLEPLLPVFLVFLICVIIAQCVGICKALVRTKKWHFVKVSQSMKTESNVRF